MKLITTFATALAINSVAASNCSSLSKRPCKRDDTCEYLRKAGSCKAKADITCSDLKGQGKMCRSYGCRVFKKECVPLVTDCAGLNNLSKCKKDPQCTFVRKTKTTPWQCIQATATTPAPTTPAPTTPAPTTPAPTTPAPTTPAPTYYYCTEDEAKALAESLGYKTSGCTFPFSGKYYTISGLYVYTGDKSPPAYKGCAFYGTYDNKTNTVLDTATHGASRVATQDCSTPAPTTPAPTTPAPTTPAPTTPAPTTPAPTAAPEPLPQCLSTSTCRYCEEDDAKTLAEKMGYDASGCSGVSFSGDYGTHGLYAYDTSSSKYSGCAYFSTPEDGRNDPVAVPQKRIGTHDCCLKNKTCTYCTADEAKELALEYGFKVENCPYSFVGFYATAGLYAYTGENSNPDYKGCAYFSDNEYSDWNSVPAGNWGKSRIGIHDCSLGCSDLELEIDGACECKFSLDSGCLDLGEFYDFTSEDIDLGHEGITAVAPGAFNDVDMAVVTGYLKLHGNELTVIRKGTFDNLDNLDTLWLLENDISEIEAGAFDNLGSLTYLQLRENQLSTLPEFIFDNLFYLETLYLHKNNLTELDQWVFSELGELKKIYLYENLLTELHPDTFFSNPKLAEISIRDNEFNSLSSDLWRNLDGLKRLKMNGNNCTLSHDGCGSYNVKPVEENKACSCN